MEIFGEEPEFMDMHKIQRVVDMFERCPRMQRIVRTSLLGLEYEDEIDDVDEDGNESDNRMHGHYNFHGYPMLSGGDRGFRGNSTRPPNSVYQPPLQYYASVGDLACQASLIAQAKKSDTEREAKLLKEMEKSKEKAEKKRLKKEEKNNVQQSKAEDSERANEKSKDGANSSVKKSTSAKDSDSSDDEYSGEDSDKNDFFESEELDMTSTFVTKAAQIAKRKSEQRPKPEKKEKKKIPVKECKTAPDKSHEGLEVKKKDSPPNTPTFEDNIKKSTDLAVIGNRFASSGDFNMAVKFFTDAIKYNPTEFKLFGNRSFCFEKMQQYEKALTDAELCLNMYPGWVKGLFRKGRALAGLKRYEEAAEAFQEVLKLDNSYKEASQELMRVQVALLMDCGFTWQQSSNALIVHGTVNEALRALSKLNSCPGTIQNGSLPTAQVVNVGGRSLVHTANKNPAASSCSSQSQDAPKTSLTYKASGPALNASNVQSQHKPHLGQPIRSSHENSPPPELFPVWVGNLVHSVTSTMITNLFSKAGVVYSVKVLGMRRCAFVNFTKQEYCDEAIRQFHGMELNGMKLAVRYPDRIPHGMGISRSALKADDPQNENTRYNSAGGRRYVPHYRQEHKTTSPESTSK